MKIAIVNYHMGNLGSVRKAFEDIGAEVIIADQPDLILDADKIVLPGVGAFSEGMESLSGAGWVPVLHELVIGRNRPLLGICLGMQMLASEGYEGGNTGGLGFVAGKVQRLDTIGCKLHIPHVGWNEVSYQTNDILFDGIPDCSDFYFVHSFAFVPDDKRHLIATTDYDGSVTAVVRKGHVFGCQFHPEKSSKAGRKLLKNFLDYEPC